MASTGDDLPWRSTGIGGPYVSGDDATVPLDDSWVLVALDLYILLRT